MKLQLSALDPLFFRNGRPFASGEESFAEGVFPPLPSTVRGALRSAWIAAQLSDTIEEPDQLARTSGGIALSYLGLGMGGKPIFPTPFDLFLSESKRAAPMSLTDGRNLSASLPTPATHLFKAETVGKTEPVQHHFLDAAAMLRYIEGNADGNGFQTFPLGEMVYREPKIGIGRDNDLHRTKEGLLFRLTTNRLHPDLDLLLEVQGFGNTPTTLLLLGAERRSATATAADFQLPSAPMIKGNHFKICLLTPALFGHWYPKHLCENHGLRLIAAATGRPQTTGGWDVLSNRPKPMRKAVAAGTTYLFQAQSETQANDLAQQYHGKSVCQPFDDLEGFGLCFVSQPFDNQNII